MLAGNAHRSRLCRLLTAVAADPKATYAERLAAAKALKGHGAASPQPGSAELDLLARGGCPSADEASKPFFVRGAHGRRGLRSQTTRRGSGFLLAAIGRRSGECGVAASVCVSRHLGRAWTRERCWLRSRFFENGGTFYGQRFCARVRLLPRTRATMANTNSGSLEAEAGGCSQAHLVRDSRPGEAP